MFNRFALTSLLTLCLAAGCSDNAPTPSSQGIVEPTEAGVATPSLAPPATATSTPGSRLDLAAGCRLAPANFEDIAGLGPGYEAEPAVTVDPSLPLGKAGVLVSCEFRADPATQPTVTIYEMDVERTLTSAGDAGSGYAAFVASSGLGFVAGSTSADIKAVEQIEGREITLLTRSGANSKSVAVAEFGSTALVLGVGPLASAEQSAQLAKELVRTFLLKA